MDNTNSLVGQTIGKYRVIEHLGRGGMAEVFKAYQPSLDRYVALKLMHAFLAGDQDFISRFEREAKNVAALRHPNIVQVYDFDVHNDTPFMVMEYIEGGTLKTHLENLLRAGKSLTISEAVSIVREVGKALAYAHGRNMIHRDVKPANVLLDQGNRVILTDFGIAKILTGPSYTMTGATIGTPAYMSPEQGLGRPGDHRSDIYALGVMLYQLATGQLPFEADTPLAVMLKHVNDPLPLPRTFQPDLPEGVERIILKAMAKNPDDRFQSAAEMLSHLENLDTATLLAIPPASMAAGPEAHASTMANPAAATLAVPDESAPPPASATVVARPGATQIAPPGAAAGATVVRKPEETAAAPTTSTGRVPAAGGAVPGAPPLPQVVTAPPARRPVMLFAVVGVVMAALLLGGGAFAVTGGFGLLNQPAPTASATVTLAPTEAPSETAAPPASPTVASTSTPDLVATQFASIQETQRSIAAALATATPSNTPDLTATFAACTFDYAVTAQDPEDGRTLTVQARTTKRLTLQNTGTCAFPEGTVLTETVPSAGLPGIQLPIAPVAVGESFELSFDWPGPRQPGQVTRVFEVHGPDGRALGQPLSLTFSYAAAPTQRAAPTATRPAPTAPPPPPASPTPAAAGLTQIYPETYISPCQYVGDGGMDYSCTVRVGYAGGQGPFTLWYNDVSVGHFAPGQAMYYNIVGRRCLTASYSIRVLDDATGTQATFGDAFNPAAYANLFPGGACTLP